MKTYDYNKVPERQKQWLYRQNQYRTEFRGTAPREKFLRMAAYVLIVALFLTALAARLLEG